jgi:hypothetical protein
MARVPLWLTIVPLALGGAVYWHYWSGYRDTLRADVAAVVPGARMTIGGFPYRIEGTIDAPAVTLTGAVKTSLRAASAIVNRGPWQRDLTVIRTASPEIDVAIPALRDVTAHLTATSAVSSIHLVAGVSAAAGAIARQSNVFTAARATTGLFAAPVTADSIEVHLRETRARSNEAWSPAPPQQAQVVLAGTGVRIGQGAPLTLAADFGITSTARLRDYPGWASGGTVELRSLILADASGEVLRMAASAVPAGGTLRLTGTITTACPATIAAAFAGSPGPVEKRLRNPVRLAFGGTPGAFTVDAPPAYAPTAVRAQLPPCPKLR